MLYGVKFVYNLSLYICLQLYCATIRDKSLLFMIIFDAGLVINRQPLINRLSNVYQPIHQPTYDPPKHAKKSNDVVEIFHNIRLKKNNFGVSIKHSKDNEAKYEKKLHLPEDKENPKRIQETVLSPKDRHSKNINQKYQSHDKKNEQDHCLQILNCQSNTLSE